MRHRLSLLLPLLLAACNGSPFPSGNKAGNEAITSNSSTTTTVTNSVNAVNAAAPPAPPPPDANAANNAAAPDGQNAAAPQPDSNAADPNANHVGGRELDEQASNLDFIVVNRTGHKIIGLSLKPFDDNRWSNNVLANRDIPNRERGAATFSRDVEICRWDLKATFDNGTTRIFPNSNLCDTVRVELH